MADLPTGTVTFLFTDVEGSTSLLQELGRDRYDRVQDDHIAIVRRAIAGGGGTVVRIEGDGFFAAFPSPFGAIHAVVSAQRDLADHRWPENAAVAVRMGLHTGEGRTGGGDYVGIDVNRAARIAEAGHGGQVLISDATRALVEHDLSDGVTLRSLGTHRLKDITHPEHLFELVIEGLPSDFPALKTLDARPNNLPPEVTSFVGREAEIRQTAHLLREHRLVTLTGPGGTGKTRLALAAGAELLDTFPDGGFIVELASLVDPGEVCPAVCQALGVREEPGTDSIDTLVNRLADKEILLILDNFEHVLEAADQVDQMLRRAARVRVLVTSRMRLGLYGEQELPVPPLALPDARNLSDPEALSGYEAVSLFFERARQAWPGFVLTDQNATAVAEICIRLDGLPLAIELAASRIKILSPDAILSRVTHRLDLLTTDARNVPERQRSLRAAMDWSYGLLEVPERHLLSRMSVFIGGGDLEAADTVGNPQGDLGAATLDVLASLVDKGLIRQNETATGDPRFGMLQTIREYAGERLEEDWDGEATRRRHAEHFLDLAEASEPSILAEDPAGLERLDLEHDNVQAALRWALQSGEVDRGMRASASIWRFWLLRSRLEGGRAWLERFLALEGGRTETRAVAHRAAASLAYWQDDLSGTEHHYHAALAIFRDLGDRRGVGQVLYDLSFVPYIRRAGYDESVRRLREAAEILDEVGDQDGAGRARDDIPYFVALAGDPEGALPAMEDALGRARERGDIFSLMDHLMRVAEGHRMVGDLERSRSTLFEALDIAEQRDIVGAAAAVLHVLSAVEVGRGHHEVAMRLHGAAQAIVDSIWGGPLPPLQEDPVGNTRKSIGNQATDRALAEGRAMSPDQAMAYARSVGT